MAGSTLAYDKNLSDLQGELAKIAATEPATYQSLLKQAQDMSYKYASLNSENAYRKAEIGLSQQRLAEEQAYHQASLGMQQARLKLASQKQGFAIQQAISKGQMPDTALSGKYGYIVDSYGNPILDKGRKIKVVSGKGGLPKIGGGLADQLGLTQNEYHSWRSRITSVSVTGRYAPTFARRSQESRKRVKRRATNVPAAATPANAAVKRLVWTQVRQALQQVVAVGAISPYLIAA